MTLWKLLSFLRWRSFLPLVLPGCCCFLSRWKFLGCPQGAFHFTIPSTTWVVFFTILKHRNTSLRGTFDPIVILGKVELFGDLICPSTSVESMPSPFSSEYPLWSGNARKCYQYSKHHIHDSVSLFYIHVISFDSMTDLYSFTKDWLLYRSVNSSKGWTLWKLLSFSSTFVR